MDRFERATDFIIIAGPTASGKSAMALRLAEQIDGHIINADSMQVYKDLCVLTARPDADDEARIPHHLYGTIDGACAYSVGMWLADLHRAADYVRGQGKWPIIVGGTGFYLNAALSGISPIPDIPAAVRAAVTAEHAKFGGQAMLDRLNSIDPVLAARLNAGDTQRLIRAFEVWQHTAVPLSRWQQESPKGSLGGRALKIVQCPPRAELYQAIDTRFDHMLKTGALAEVGGLLARRLDDTLPVMKALGVRTLRDYLQGRTDIAAAACLAKRDSRHYAKRQMTWLRNNFISNIKSETKYSKRTHDKIFAKILEFI